MWDGYKAVDSWFQGLHLLFLNAACWTMNRTSSAKRVFLSRSFSLLFMLTEASVRLFTALLMWKQVGRCTNFLLFNNDSDYQKYLFRFQPVWQWYSSLAGCVAAHYSPAGDFDFCGHHVVVLWFQISLLALFSHQNPFKSHADSFMCAHTRFSAC